MKQVTASVSRNLNANFSIKAVDYQFFNKIELTDAYIEDQSGDTLLFAPKILGNVRKLNRKNRRLEFSKLYLYEPIIHFRIDSNNIINIKFITDQLRKKDTAKLPFILIFSDLEIENGIFTLEDAIQKPRSAPIHFGDLHLENLNINLNEFETRSGGVHFLIRELNFLEKSGFELKSLHAEMDVFRKHLQFEEIGLLTNFTEIYADRVSLEFEDFKEFKDFNNKVTLDIDIARSNILLQDVGYFAGVMENIGQYIRYSGHVSGPISNLHGRDISFDIGEDSQWSGQFDITGLPDLEETFAFIEMKSRNILPGILDIIAESTDFDSIILPRNISKLGQIHFNGLITGFYNDFVSYGEFQTDLGHISTDLSLSLDTLDAFQFGGKLEARSFMLGHFLDNQDLFGNISMSLDVNGTMHQDSTISSQLAGIIQNIEINGYEYRNIQMDGLLEKRSFDGSVIIKDPHLDLDFLGLIDFTKDISEFDFTLNVPYAHLDDLNVFPDDSTAEVSLLMTANFVGNTLDDMNGMIKLLNSKLTYQGETLEAYDFTLEATNRPDSSWIILRTDYLDASINGQYEFKKLVPSIQYVQYKMLPSTLASVPDTAGINQNEFHFEFIFKDLEKPGKIFFPHIDPGPNLSIKGWFDPARNDIYIESQTGHFNFNEFQIREPQLQILTGDHDDMEMTLASKGLHLSPNLDFDEFNLKASVQNDSLIFGLKWLEKDSLNYQGDLSLLTVFGRNMETHNMTSRIEIPARKFIHNENEWRLAPGEIFVDSTTIHFKNLELSSNEKLLGLDGTVSKNPADTLLLRARNIQINEVRLLNNKLSLSGIFDGNARLSDLYNNPMILSALDIQNLDINDEPLGNGSFISIWDPAAEAIKFQTEMKRGNLTPISVDGQISTTDRMINFNVETEKLRLKIFQPFVRSLTSDLNGLITSQVEIKGPQDALKINGVLEFQKTSMKVDFLNTKFSFSDEVSIDNNRILIPRVEIYDSLGNKAIANGFVDFSQFDEVRLDLQFDAENLLMMNLSEWQNTGFYGQAFGTGVISLNGPTRDLKIDIAAQAVDNTRFFLPLNRGGTGGDLSFVSFTTEPVQEVNPANKQSGNTDRKSGKKSRIELNITLEPTVGAETTLLFDPNAGGSLSARGSGELKMNVQPGSDFNISGEYTIDQGTYNFVLSQVINKKFEVRGGSKISWNGNPTEAILDVVAVYKLRTSLYNLFYDEAYRRRIPVDCEIHLTGPVASPEIGFNIELPTSDEDTKSRLSNSINTEEDMTKQFLSLLIVNSFLPDPNYAPTGSQGLMNNSVEVTTAEVLSNQLSNWVSQISNDFDIGFHYRPGDDVSRQEIEVALSTQILDDRVLINSNIGVGGGTNNVSENTNNIAGDVSVEVKIDKRGKFRVKAFTRPNDKLIYESSPYTSGIGIFFREEFNSIGALIKGYWIKIFGKKNKETTEEKELADSQ